MVAFTACGGVSADRPVQLSIRYVQIYAWTLLSKLRCIRCLFRPLAVWNSSGRFSVRLLGTQATPQEHDKCLGHSSHRQADRPMGRTQLSSSAMRLDECHACAGRSQRLMCCLAQQLRYQASEHSAPARQPPQHGTAVHSVLQVTYGMWTLTTLLPYSFLMLNSF
jgi:hypothetical protein